jgi:integrase
LSSKLLTDAACRRYARRRERYRIRDLGARSLYFVVEPSGFKAFEMRFRRPGGKPGKVRLGPFDINGKELKGEPTVGQPLSLSAARHLSAAIHRQRAMGVDVLSDIKARRLHQRVDLEQQAGNTFVRCAVDYINEYAKPQTKRWRETALVLGLRYGDDDDAEPEIVSNSMAARWASRAIGSITDHDLFGVISEAKKSGIPGKDVRNKGVSDARARDLHTKLSGMFTWLRKQRRVTIDPFANLDLPAAAQDRDRVLNDGELRLLWRALDREPILGPIIKLLTLTGARRREASDMRWSELSDCGTTWTIPGARTKNGKVHVVPLSRAAQALLTGVPRVAGSDFVFTRNGKTPPSGWSPAKRRIDAAMAKTAGKAIPHWVVHDLRRTAVTQMAQLKVPVDVIELCVGHTSGSRAGIVGIYNRSELLDERRDALERWSRHLAGIISNKAGNVVPMRKGGKAARKS